MSDFRAERSRFDALEAEVRGLSNRIADAEKLAEFERLEERGEAVSGPMSREAWPARWRASALLAAGACRPLRSIDWRARSRSASRACVPSRPR